MSENNAISVNSSISNISTISTINDIKLQQYNIVFNF